MERGSASSQHEQEVQATLATHLDKMQTCEERFALTVHGSNDGWWDCDLRTHSVYFSPRWKQLLGYRDEEIPNHLDEWIKRVHPADLSLVTTTVLEQQMHGHSASYEFDHRVLHKDGSYRWQRARGSALRDEQGSVYRVAGWHTDITDRKREEEIETRRIQHAAFRVDVSMALTERALLPTILQRCTEAMVQHLHAAFARVWTLKPGEDTLVLQASAGLYTHLDGSHARITPGTLKIGRIAQERRPYLTNDVLNDPQINDIVWARRQEMTSFAGYPLLVEDQVVGVMAMFSQHPLMDDTLDALATVANAIAQGIGRKWAEEHLEERVNERTRELALLLEISHNIASTLELKSLLDTILTQLKTVIDYQAVVLYAYQDNRLTILNYQGEKPLEQIRWLLSLVEQDMTQILQYQRYDPFMIEDIAQDTRLSQRSVETANVQPASDLAQLRSSLAVPLIVKDRVIGLLTLFHYQPCYYTYQHANLARTLAYQAALALENARLYGQAQELAILQERQRLARELHDSVSQALYGIVLGTRSARALLHRDVEKLATLLENVQGQAETGLAEMRTLIFELRPESLEIDGLVIALKKQVIALQARYELTILLELGEEPALPFLVKEALYRIALEAMHNIVKHARASTATVRLSTYSNVAGIVLEVSDDGVGFDAGRSFPGHLGLQSMRERLARLGGHLHIASSADQGTLIRATIP